MAKKPLADLSNVELQDARRLWHELVADTRRSAAENPYPGSNSVIDGLEASLDDCDKEISRRYPLFKAPDDPSSG